MEGASLQMQHCERDGGIVKEGWRWKSLPVDRTRLGGQLYQILGGDHRAGLDLCSRRGSEVMYEQFGQCPTLVGNRTA